MLISCASARCERNLSICDFDCSRLFFSELASFCILAFSARRNLTMIPISSGVADVGRFLPACASETE